MNFELNQKANYWGAILLLQKHPPKKSSKQETEKENPAQNSIIWQWWCWLEIVRGEAPETRETYLLLRLFLTCCTGFFSFQAIKWIKEREGERKKHHLSLFPVKITSVENIVPSTNWFGKQKKFLRINQKNINYCRVGFCLGVHVLWWTWTSWGSIDRQ